MRQEPYSKNALNKKKKRSVMIRKKIKINYTIFV